MFIDLIEDQGQKRYLIFFSDFLSQRTRTGISLVALLLEDFLHSDTVHQGNSDYCKDSRG